MIFGALRIKNESRWIERVIRAAMLACDRVFVMDDNSTDDTVKICRKIRGVKVFRSPFKGIDESRDKNWLLERVYEAIPEEDTHYTRGNPECPHWMLAIDGDEELVAEDAEVIRQLVQIPNIHAWAMRILYLWDSPDQIRVDGVYRDFSRPSLFRLMNRQFRYMTTPFGNGANFHCSSIPQELIGTSQRSPARLLHWGYIDRELRLKKFEFYNRVDPENAAEDQYRHMVVGDLFPADSHFRHAGPLELEEIACPTAA